jgi:hypothetical protein
MYCVRRIYKVLTLNLAVHKILKGLMDLPSLQGNKSPIITISEAATFMSQSGYEICEQVTTQWTNALKMETACSSETAMMPSKLNAVTAHTHYKQKHRHCDHRLGVN